MPLLSRRFARVLLHVVVLFLYISCGNSFVIKSSTTSSSWVLSPNKDGADGVKFSNHNNKMRYHRTKKSQGYDDDTFQQSTRFMSSASDHNSQTNSRRQFFQRVLVTTASAAAAVAVPSSPAQAMNSKSRSIGYDVQKSEKEWESQLSSMQYYVLRNGGTERPYSSILEGEERLGIYKCAGCGTALFDSKEKFHSGTGWPSYARGLAGVEVEAVNPVQASLVGAELRCKTCGGHLGDVFQDGYLFVGTPAFTSGKRFCIDGAALVFEPDANGEKTVAGDLPPPKKDSTPDWLSTPKITPTTI
mmetsp:Transcript_33517/g.49629  ORF Transcript_33517/g.49629 Transcript_33517/m.49629 type:complete len:302 (-) Transcript_33517:199-1104(-)